VKPFVLDRRIDKTKDQQLGLEIRMQIASQTSAVTTISRVYSRERLLTTFYTRSTSPAALWRNTSPQTSTSFRKILAQSCVSPTSLDHVSEMVNVSENEIYAQCWRAPSIERFSKKIQSLQKGQYLRIICKDRTTFGIRKANKEFIV
jgi:hypothetical protein